MTSDRYSHLLQPGRIGQLDLRNRIVVTAMGVSLSEDDGSVGERLIAYHEEQAKGGAGLIVSGVTGVAWPVGAVSVGQTAISEDRFIPGLKQLTDRVHRHGARIAAQLHHGGLVAAYSHARWGHPLWAPSVPPMPSGNITDHYLMNELAGLEGMKIPEVKVLDESDIAVAVDQFAMAAKRAVEAGFDGIEIHGGHGYLLSSFTSPYTNKRTDGYGGTREGRMRLTLEVLEAVRGAVGPNFPVWVKLDSREVGKSGITIEEAVEHARMIETAGADAITVTAYHETGEGKLHSQSHTPHLEAYNLPSASAIKQGVSIPVLASGRVEPDVADKFIGEKRIDFVAMGRKLLADPHLPRKLTAGETDKVRPCIYCYTCISAIYMGQEVRCAVNAELGHEFMPAEPKAMLGHVVVVGGGPAGMEATRRLTAAGVRVTLLEANDRLGGTLRFASLAYEPNERILEWLKREVAASGATVMLSTPATTDLLRTLAPDAVIVATGAQRAMPRINGGELPHVLSGDDLRKMMLGQPNDVPTGPFGRLALKIAGIMGLTANGPFLRWATHRWMPLGKQVVVIGGELVGLELAEFLCERGRTVNVVDTEPRLGKGLPLVRRMRLIEELGHHNVKLWTAVSDIDIDADHVRFSDSQGQSHRFAANTVIVAKGATGDVSLARRLQDDGFVVRAIGDATGVSYIEGAIHGARDAVDDLLDARNLGTNIAWDRFEPTQFDDMTIGKEA